MFDPDLATISTLSMDPQQQSNAQSDAEFLAWVRPLFHVSHPLSATDSPVPYQADEAVVDFAYKDEETIRRMYEIQPAVCYAFFRPFVLQCSFILYFSPIPD